MLYRAPAGSFAVRNLSNRGRLASFGAADNEAQRAAIILRRAKAYQASAKRYRAEMWTKGILTKKRRDLEKKANDAARRGNEQMRLYRAAMTASKKAARVARKQGVAVDMTDMDLTLEEPLPEEVYVDDGSGAAYDATAYDAGAAGASGLPSWAPVAGAAAAGLLIVGIVMSRRG